MAEIDIIVEVKSQKGVLGRNSYKDFLEVCTIRTAWVWCKDRKMSQWNKTETLEISWTYTDT